MAAVNIESMTVFLNIVQESQELLGSLRHAVRGINRLRTIPPETTDGRQTPGVRLPSVVFLFYPLPSAQPSAAPPPVFHGVSPPPEDRHCAPVAVPSVLFAPLVAIPVSAYGIVRLLPCPRRCV